MTEKVANSSRRTRSRRRWPAAAIFVAAALLSPAANPTDAVGQTKRDFRIVANQFTFQPSRIIVNTGDVVRIVLVAEDIPHSFTIDGYRISKRASPGREAIIEFCPDRAGRYVFYCNLTQDERCRGMRGELVVQ